MFWFTVTTSCYALMRCKQDPPIFCRDKQFQNVETFFCIAMPGVPTSHLHLTSLWYSHCQLFKTNLFSFIINIPWTLSNLQDCGGPRLTHLGFHKTCLQMLCFKHSAISACQRRSVMDGQKRFKWVATRAKQARVWVRKTACLVCRSCDHKHAEVTGAMSRSCAFRLMAYGVNGLLSCSKAYCFWNLCDESFIAFGLLSK